MCAVCACSVHGRWCAVYHREQQQLVATGVRISDLADGLCSTLMFSETVKGQYVDLRGFG
jgi:hypothetical protein